MQTSKPQTIYSGKITTTTSVHLLMFCI